ncbi:MAG: class I SAM-dependent RNA methyltransferase [Clostridiales bacterium]|nr:class I SAM-dependent RNA methyltransferase [Clostridiales bacterium]
MKKMVDIFDISYDGSGVGKIDGKVVFVPKSLYGEKVEVEVVKDTSSFYVGRVLNMIEKNKSRIVPKCPYFEKCGGCDFQHCDSNMEKEIKKNILKNELKKVGWWGDVEYVESDKRFAYRNKIKFEVFENKLGYFESKSHKFLEVKRCEIADEKINEALEKISLFLFKNNLKNLKNVYIKIVGEKIAICFLFDKTSQKIKKNIKKIDIFDGFSVFFAYGDVLESDKTKVFCMYGNQKLISDLGDVEVEQDISAFNQINNFVAKKLYDFIVEQTTNSRVVNAYSGQGLLSYLISKKAKIVYGIECQKSAHLKAERLKEKCKANKLENICGKVEDCLQTVLLADRIDAVVLDPARQGCDKKVLQAILNEKIEKIIYISCNFSTLIRDLKILKEKYELKKVSIFDMFPCTSNLETAVVLERK